MERSPDGVNVARRRAEPWPPAAKAQVAAAAVGNPIIAGAAVAGAVAAGFALAGRRLDPLGALKRAAVEIASAGRSVTSVQVEGDKFDAPVFDAPTFQAPSFAAPTFQAPTFQAPSFAAPTFQAPTFQAPSFAAPTFQAPSFAAPTFQAPTFPSALPPPSPATAVPERIAEAREELFQGGGWFTLPPLGEGVILPTRGGAIEAAARGAVGGVLGQPVAAPLEEAGRAGGRFTVAGAVGVLEGVAAARQGVETGIIDAGLNLLSGRRPGDGSPVSDFLDSTREFTRAREERIMRRVEASWG